MRPLARKCKALRRCTRGVAALEAAIILPLVIFFIIGTVELYQQYRAQSQVDFAANSIARSLAVQTALYKDGACNSSNAVCVYEGVAKVLLRPLDFQDNGQVSLSVWVAQESDGQGFFWSLGSEAGGWNVTYPSGAAIAHPRLGQLDSFPSARAGDVVIVAEAVYQYTPFVLSRKFWNLVTGDTILYSRAVVRPLNSDLLKLLDANN